MPLISVIVPVFNAEKTLNRCVDSILAQTFTDFELLLVDDGSKDNSGAMCDEYVKADSRVRAFHKRNGGVSSARNVGLNVSKGEYIAFADSDDEVYPQWLSSFISALEENNQKDVMLIEGVEWIQYAADGQKINCDDKQDQVISLETLFEQNNIWGGCWNKVFLRSILNDFDICFDENLHYCEDCLFVATYVSHMSNVKVIDYVGYRYYGPDNYADKYSKVWPLDTVFEYYSKLKKSNPLCFRELADGFFMTFLSLYKGIDKVEKRDALRLFREIIGTDITYVKGRKKFLARRLDKVNNLAIWNMVLTASSNWIL